MEIGGNIVGTLNMFPDKDDVNGHTVLFQLKVLNPLGKSCPVILLRDFPFNLLKRTFIYLATKRKRPKINFNISTESDWCEKKNFSPWDGDYGIALIVSEKINKVILFIRTRTALRELYLDYVKIAMYICQCLGLSQYIVEIEGVIFQEEDGRIGKTRKSVFKTKAHRNNTLIYPLQICVQSDIPASFVHDILLERMNAFDRDLEIYEN